MHVTAQPILTLKVEKLLVYILLFRVTINIIKVRLMCALRAHIKFSIFRNILLGIEKVVITFSNLEKFFSKNGN